MSKDQVWNITFFFHTNRSNNLFADIFRLENDKTFQDSVGTLCSRPAAHNFSILDAGQASSELAQRKTVGQEDPVCPLKITRRAGAGPAKARMKGCR